MVTRRQNSLSNLFEAARQVSPPPLDVRQRVRDTLGTLRPAVVSDAPLWIAATISMAAAAAVLMMVLGQNSTTNDPFVQWLTSYVVAL
ncbi:MAG: hypothetical protein ACYC6N_09095 [Pirellulaceae bacterium]